MEENQFQEQNDQVVSDNSTKIHVWNTIENITTITLTAGLFLYTRSGWCFLLLFNLNNFKSSFKNNKQEQ